jgi:hypothetical protein
VRQIRVALTAAQNAFADADAGPVRVAGAVGASFGAAFTGTDGHSGAHERPFAAAVENSDVRALPTSVVEADRSTVDRSKQRALTGAEQCTDPSAHCSTIQSTHSGSYLVAVKLPDLGSTHAAAHDQRKQVERRTSATCVGEFVRASTQFATDVEPDTCALASANTATQFATDAGPHLEAHGSAVLYAEPCAVPSADPGAYSGADSGPDARADAVPIGV